MNFRSFLFERALYCTEDTTFGCVGEIGFLEVFKSNLHGRAVCRKGLVQVAEKETHAAILIMLGLRKAVEEPWNVHVLHVVGNSVLVAPIHALCEGGSAGSSRSVHGSNAGSIAVVTVLGVALAVRSGVLDARWLGCPHLIQGCSAHGRNNVRSDWKVKLWFCRRDRVQCDEEGREMRPCVGQSGLENLKASIARALQERADGCSRLAAINTELDTLQQSRSLLREALDRFHALGGLGPDVLKGSDWIGEDGRSQNFHVDVVAPALAASQNSMKRSKYVVLCHLDEAVLADDR